MQNAECRMRNASGEEGGGQYRSYAPEKFELWDGYLFSGPEYPEDRHGLLRLLLVNVGLLEAVKLVPEQRWQESLGRVYG